MGRLLWLGLAACGGGRAAHDAGRRRFALPRTVINAHPHLPRPPHQPRRPARRCGVCTTRRRDPWSGAHGDTRAASCGVSCHGSRVSTSGAVGRLLWLGLAAGGGGRAAHDAGRRLALPRTVVNAHPTCPGPHHPPPCCPVPTLAPHPPPCLTVWGVHDSPSGSVVGCAWGHEGGFVRRFVPWVPCPVPTLAPHPPPCLTVWGVHDSPSGSVVGCAWGHEGGFVRRFVPWVPGLDVGREGGGRQGGCAQ